MDSTAGGDATSMRSLLRVNIGVPVAGMLGAWLVVAAGLSALYDVPLIRSAPAVFIGCFAIVQWLVTRRSRPIPYPLRIFLVFVAFLVVGLFYTRSPQYGASKLLLMGLFWGVFALGLHEAFPDREHLVSFLRGVLAGGVLYTILVFATVGDPLTVLAEAGRFFRLRAAGENPIYIGRAFGLSVLVGIWFLGERRSLLRWLIVVPLIGVMVSYMVATASKGPLLSLALGFAAYSVLQRGARRWIALSVFAAGTAFYLYVSMRMAELLDYRLLRTVLPSLQQRVGSSKAALEGFIHGSIRQIAFGDGIGSFSHLERAADVRHYPHNIFAEVLYEAGLLGILLLVLALAAPAVAIGRRLVGGSDADDPTWRRIAAAGLALYVFALANAQVTGDLGSNLWIPIGGAFLVTLSEISSRRGGNEIGLPRGGEAADPSPAAG